MDNTEWRNNKNGRVYHVIKVVSAAWDPNKTYVVYEDIGKRGWVREFDEFIAKFTEVIND